MTQCARCDSRTATNALLCRKHAGKLADTLREVPALVNDLTITITRQDRLSAESMGRSTAEAPLAWNEHASATAIDLNATINAWALAVHQQHPDPDDPLTPTRYPAHDTTRVARWLHRHHPQLIAHPDAGQAFSDLTTATRRAREAVDYPYIRTRFMVGPCPEDVDNHPCDGEVWAHIPVDETKPSLMRCTNTERCGAVWNTSQWLRAGARIVRRQAQIVAMRHATGEDN